jgi:hypothetical protein
LNYSEVRTKIIRSKAISRSRFCLRRSLILFSLMRHRYPDILINIGMDFHNPSNFTGHCWLTLNGAPFLPDPGRDDKAFFPHEMGKKGQVMFWSR